MPVLLLACAEAETSATFDFAARYGNVKLMDTSDVQRREICTSVADQVEQELSSWTVAELHWTADDADALQRRLLTQPPLTPALLRDYFESSCNERLDQGIAEQATSCGGANMAALDAYAAWTLDGLQRRLAPYDEPEPDVAAACGYPFSVTMNPDTDGTLAIDANCFVGSTLKVDGRTTRTPGRYTIEGTYTGAGSRLVATFRDGKSLELTMDGASFKGTLERSAEADCVDEGVLIRAYDGDTRLRCVADGFEPASVDELQALCDAPIVLD